MTTHSDCHTLLQCFLSIFLYFWLSTVQLKRWHWFYKQTNRQAILYATISQNNRVINSILTFNCPVKRDSQLTVCLVWCPRDSNKTAVLWSCLATTSEERQKSVAPPKKQTHFSLSVPWHLLLWFRVKTTTFKDSQTDRKNHWKVWELVNMGVVLPQPQKPVRGWLWERADKRGRKIRLASILLI